MLTPDKNGICPVCGESACSELATSYDIGEAFSLTGQAKSRPRSKDLVTITDRVWLETESVAGHPSKELVWTAGDRVDREHAEALDAPYERDTEDAGDDDPRLNDPDKPAKRGRGRPRKVQPQ